MLWVLPPFAGRRQIQIVVSFPSSSVRLDHCGKTDTSSRSMRVQTLLWVPSIVMASQPRQPTLPRPNQPHSGLQEQAIDRLLSRIRKLSGKPVLPPRPTNRSPNRRFRCNDACSNTLAALLRLSFRGRKDSWDPLWSNVCFGLFPIFVPVSAVHNDSFGIWLVLNSPVWW